MTRRWFPLLALAVTAYLAWRLALVIQTPTLPAAALLMVELLAWIGFGAFLLRVSPPSRPHAAQPEDGAAPPVVVAVLGAGQPHAALERSILSLDSSRAQVLLVDDSRREPAGRVAIDDLATAAHGSVIVAKSEGMAAAVVALAAQVDDDAVLVLVEAGSVLASTAIDALLEPLRDPSVGAVQGAIGWADSSTLNSNAPSREGMGLFNAREAPAAGDAGVSPITGNGSALRVRALRDVIAIPGDLGVALNAHGWTTRFSTAPAVYRRPPASSVEWRALRTNKLASERRRAWGALFVRNLRPATRARIVADGGDIASAFARVGALVLVVFALLSGTVPVPGSLGVTLAVSGVLWAFAALATRSTVSPILRFGDRVRLGWHRLDADALAAFVPTGLRVSSAHPGRFRALAAFPLSVVALVAIDAAGIVRALTLIDPGIVDPISTTLARAAIGVATLASLAFLFDALRIFVARPDARDDLRVRTMIQAVLTFSDGRTNVADMVDLSSIGAGLMTDAPLARGDRVHLHFELPGQDNPIDLVITTARIEGEGSERLVGVEFGRLDPITRTALLRYVAKNPPVREEALPAASAFPRIATMPVPRPVLRFASVLTVIVVTTALFVGTAVAAPTSEAFLTGTVSGPSGPIANICVSAQSSSNWNWSGTQTDDSGSFTLPVASDTYRIQYRDCRTAASDRLMTGWWSPGGLVNDYDALPVTVAEGETRSGFDATLQAGGWFTAKLLDAAGSPLDGVCVNPVSSTSWSGGTRSPAQGGAAGSVETDALLPGPYRIHFQDCSGQAEPIAQGFLGPDGTSLVPFQDDGKVFDVAGSPIDLGTITLSRGTRLTGTVHDDTGAPIANVCAGVVSQSWNWVGGGWTGPDGSYITDPLLPGTWVISFQDCNEPRSVMNTLWTGTDAVINDLNAATPIAVTGESALQGPYDQVMQIGGTLSGVVTNDNGPISSACVNANTIDGNSSQWLAGTQSAKDGTFTLGPVLGENVIIQVDQCSSTVPIVSGVYAGPDEPLTREYPRAARLSVAPAQHITDLVLRPQLGTNLAGTVTGDGAPLGDVCVSALDAATGAVDGRYTGGDGRWSMVVPPGSFVIQAIDCSPGRNFAGRFSVDATAPSDATPVVADGSQEHTNLDINLVQGAATSITGRVVTGNGEFPAACAVAVSPNTEPAAIVQTGADGSFVLGPLSPGSYLVGLAGCDFSQDMPPDIIDPGDPSIVYPLQWSSGTPLTPENLWVDPAWVTAASGTPTDLGTICLQPCNRPEPPTTTEAPTTTTTTTSSPAPTTSGVPTTAPAPTSSPAPPTTSPAPRPPIVGTGAGTFVRSNLPPVVMPPAQSTIRPSSTQQALRSIPPPPAPVGKVATQVDVHGSTVTRTPRAAPVTFTRNASAPTAPGTTSSWWWLFVVAGVIGLGAATIPWYRRRRIARSV